MARRGQVALLLLRRSEQLERLRHADGLRRGEQRGQIAVHAGHQADGVGVARLAEAQAAVLLRDLDAEGADLAQTLDHVGRDLSLPVDPVAVHPLRQEALEPVDERAGPRQLRRVHGWGRDGPGRAGTSPRTARARSWAPANPFRGPLRRPRGPPARSRARCASGVTGGVRTSVMALGLGEGVGGGRAQPADSVQNQFHDVALPALQVAASVQIARRPRAPPCGRESGGTSRAR